MNFGEFVEPCAGDGVLIKHLEEHCGFTGGYGFDIEPNHSSISKIDASNETDMANVLSLTNCNKIITNTPWDWKLLEPMLELWLSLGFECWLLLPSDFAHNARSSKFIRRCTDIVPVGRLKWIPDSKYTGKDNCAWYRFVPWQANCKFHPRKRDLENDK